MAKRAVPKLKCLQCDKIIPKTPRAHRRKFCDDHCRWTWHNAETRAALKTVRAMKTAPAIST